MLGVQAFKAHIGISKERNKNNQDLVIAAIALFCIHICQISPLLSHYLDFTYCVVNRNQLQKQLKRR